MKSPLHQIDALRRQLPGGPESLEIVWAISAKLQERYGEAICRKSRAFHALIGSSVEQDDPPVDSTGPTSAEIIVLLQEEVRKLNVVS